MDIPPTNETDQPAEDQLESDPSDADASRRRMTKPMTIAKRAYATIESNLDLIYDRAPDDLTDKELGSLVAQHRLKVVEQIERLLQGQRIAAVSQLRLTGHGWASVAEHLGLASRQHAWITYAGLVENPAGTLERDALAAPEPELDELGFADEHGVLDQIDSVEQENAAHWGVA